MADEPQTPLAGGPESQGTPDDGDTPLSPAQQELFRQLDELLQAGHVADARQWWADHGGDPNLLLLVDSLDRFRPIPHIPGYDLLRELGRGGMGVVYLARDQKLDQLVALKVILSGQFASDNARQRFRFEAQKMAELGRHPNIVRVYRYDEYQGHPFYSMELVEGTTLQAAFLGVLAADQAPTVGDRPPATPPHPAPQPAVAGRMATVEEQRRAAALLATLAEAVQYAHDHGIIHRDLKPANVLLDRSGTPYLSDFGLAKDLQRRQGVTEEGAALGTPQYMAPEQAQGKQLTVQADVYGLGAVFFFLLTGQPPFQADSRLSVSDQRMSILNQLRDYLDPPAPRALNPRVSPDAEAICRKCLQKKPGDRYQSARELAEDLRRFINDDRVRARKKLPWRERLTRRVKRITGKVARWANSNRLAAVIGVLLLVISVVVFGNWWHQAAAQAEEATVQANRMIQYHAEADREYLKALAWLEKVRQNPEDWDSYHLATAALDRAILLLKDHSPDDGLCLQAKRLRVTVEKSYQQARAAAAERERTQHMRERLTRIRLGRGGSGATVQPLNEHRRADDFAQAFADFGMDPINPGAGGVAAVIQQIRDSKLRVELVTALLEWATAERKAGDMDPSRVNQVIRRYFVLLGVAERADDNTPWHRRFYSALRVPGIAFASLVKLSEETDLTAHSPATLALVGELASHNPARAAAFLKRVQRQYPGDFWVNNVLADTLMRVPGAKDEEKLLYAMIAVSLAPDEPVVHNRVGVIHAKAGRLDEALSAFRKAAATNPPLEMAWANLLQALTLAERWEEARAVVAQAKKHKWGQPAVLSKLGKLQGILGDYEGAAQTLREAVALGDNPFDPEQSLSHHEAKINLSATLEQIGKFTEAISVFDGGKALSKTHLLHLQAKKALTRQQQLLALEPHLDELVRAARDGRPARVRPADEQLHLRLLWCKGYHASVLCMLERLSHPATSASTVGLLVPASGQGPMFAAYTLVPRRTQLSAWEVPANLRQSVSWVAIQAGCGQCPDAGPYGRDQRARWRKLALDLLRADLQELAARRKHNPGKALSEFRGALSLWRDHPAMSAARGQSLERLPEAERAAWRQTWDELEALLKL